MSPIPDSNIVLRLPREQKGRYVAASRAAGTTLAAWIFAQLDAASAQIPPAAPDPEPGTAKPRWTPAEDAQLGTLPDAELARRLGRSRASVIARRIRLGIESAAPVGRPVGCSSGWGKNRPAAPDSRTASGPIS